MKALAEQDGEDFPTGVKVDRLANFNSRNVLDKVP